MSDLRSLLRECRPHLPAELLERIELYLAQPEPEVGNTQECTLGNFCPYQRDTLRANLPEQPKERELLRSAQAEAVMPLIGPLLDALEGLPNDEIGALDPELFKFLLEIQKAMLDHPAHPPAQADAEPEPVACEKCGSESILYECVACSHSTYPKPTKIRWLIERGSPAEYFKTQHYGSDEWTTDPHKAFKFRTDVDAKEYWRVVFPLRVMSDLRICEHVFMNEPPAQAVPEGFVLVPLKRREVEELIYFHESEQEDADSMGAECFGNRKRAEELRAMLAAAPHQGEKL